MSVIFVIPADIDRRGSGLKREKRFGIKMHCLKAVIVIFAGSDIVCFGEIFGRLSRLLTCERL